MSMTTWVALLYSVVLGPGKRVVMADLRELAASVGLENPRTVVATGNLVFETPQRHTARHLTRRIESAVASRFGRDIDVILRNAAGWRRLLDNNPFPDASRHDASHVTVRIMRDPIAEPAFDRLDAYRRGDERIEVVGGDIWLYFPHGIAKSKLAAALTPRRAGGAGTVRNWNTLLRIAAVLQ